MMNDAESARRAPVEPVPQAERLKAAAVHVALDAVVISDEEGRIHELNPAAERLFRRTVSPSLSLYMSDLIVAPPADAAVGAHKGNILFDVGQRLLLEGRDATGATFPAEMAVQQVEVCGRTWFAAYVRDLSAERAAAAALAIQRARTEEVERMTAMSTLLSGVAHELNNPLAILVAQATLLREKASTPDVTRRAEKLEAAAQRAGRIVQSFLALAHQKTPVLTALDLEDVVDGALELVGFALRSGSIALDRERRAPLPSVQGDGELLGQVFAHLLVDAQTKVLARPAGRRITVVSDLVNDRAVITIAHNVPAAPAIAGIGIGIGLTLCRSLLDAHGGTMRIDTLPEGGVAIQVTLPAAAPRLAVPVPAQVQAELAVLVVDDEIEVGEALAELIALFGHHVVLETTAAAALARLDTTRFDVVFTDYRMPGLDGLAFRRAIGARDAALAARTIIVTGDTVAAAVDGIRSPADPEPLSLRKPFTASDVRAVLVRVATA